MEMGIRPNNYHQEAALRIERLLVAVHACGHQDRLAILHELLDASRIGTVQEIAATAAGLIQYLMGVLNVEKAVVERQLLEQKGHGQGVH